MNRLTSIPASRQRGHGLGHPGPLADHVQAPLGRQLGPTLGDESELVGASFEGDRHDRRIDGQFQVEPALHGLAEQPEVAVLDVAAILAEVDRDPVRAAEFRLGRGPDRVGLAAPPGLAEGGHVVDVHSQSGHGSHLPGPIADAALRLARDRPRVEQSVHGLTYQAAGRPARDRVVGARSNSRTRVQSDR